MKEICVEKETHGLLVYLCDERNDKNFDETIREALKLLMREKK